MSAAVIVSFKNQEARDLWAGKFVRRIPSELQRAARRKMRMIDASASRLDLSSPPGNRLERLRGDRAGQYSIRINRQWRICFYWEKGDAHSVEVVDYH